MNKQNSTFPWFNQAQLQWLEQKTAHLQWNEKLNKQQELYRLALPKIQEKQYISQRQEAKNELFQKIEQIKDPVQKQQMMTKLRTEDLADFAKQMNPQLKYNAPIQDIFAGVLNEAKSRGIQPQIIENYLNGKDENFLYMMGYKQKEAPQGGIKGLASRMAWDRWWGEWLNPVGKLTEVIDDVVQKIPTLSVDERDQFARERLGGFGEGMGAVPTMLINALPSLAKTATGVSRAITNPIETTAGLGTLAFTKEGHNMLKDRYWTNIQKTATEDPVGLASDLLTLVAWGAGVLSKGASMGAKGAQLANMGKTAGSLSKVSGNLGKFASTANAVADLGMSTLQDGALSKLSNAIAKSQWIAKWGLKYLQFTQAPLQASKEALADMGKYIDNKLIDEKTQKALENNPYIAKWWEKTKAYIDEAWLSPESKKEVNTNHIQELGNEILEMIKEKESSLKDSWDLYEKIKADNISFENVVGDIKIRSYLEDLGIKIGDDGVFNFDNSTIVKDSDMKAIQRAYEWATRGEYDAQGGLNQRRKLDQLAYPDGAPSEGTKVIKGMRKLFDEMLKENIPWLKEADANYSSQIQALNEIKEGLVYKQGSNKGQIRDNFNQIINTLDWPNRAKMLERLEGLRPWLWDEIRAVHLMKNLADSYYKQPKARGITQMTTGVVGGAMAWGVAWALVGAGLQWLGEKFLKNLNQKRVQDMIDNLSEKEKKQLNVIGEKKQKKQALSTKEQNTLDSFLSKAKESDKGLNKLREWAETKYQLAEEIKSENFKNWFGDWENDPKNASKVVNEKGEPLVVYHGSPEKFTIFDSEFMSLHGSSKGYGFYFSPDKKMAEGYGDVMTVYLDIKNPLSKDKLSISRKEMKNLILDIEKNIAKRWGTDDGTLLDNFWDTKRYGKDRVLADAIDMLMENESDVDVFGELKNIGGDYDSVAKSFRKILGKDGIITPKEYIVFESNQIKSATDNIGTFDTNNPDIRYQKHWVANTIEKGISAERAIQLKNIRNGKSVQDLADHYGIDIETVEKIATPEGVKAYGKYGDWIITLAEKIKEWTASHELFHATFDLVDSRRKENILKQIEKSKGLDSLNAEEYLADSFSEYFRTGKFDTKSFGKGLVEKIKQYFYQVKQFITGANKNKGQVKKLFDEILDGEVDRNMLGEILGKEKKHSATRPTEKFNRETMQNAHKRIIHITDDNARYFKKNLDQLTNRETTAEEFFQWLKDVFWSKKNTAYMDREINWERYYIRIADHSANARNFAHNKEFTNNTSLVIKIWERRFKGDKRVDLVEYVYNGETLTPEKKKGLINGLKDLMDTGKYTDKSFDDKYVSLKASLENGEVKYQLVYHWSPYEFTKFDSSHMGKGAGSQAHGWGHYVSMDKEIWKAYADPTQTPWESLRFKWKKGSLYEVEIPDPITANTPTGKNYLEEWDFYNNDLLEQFWEKLGNKNLLISSYGGRDWESLYRAIVWVLWNEKKASKFLEKLWYDGIHYHGGIDWEAYVIFDDAKLEIKKHGKL